MTKAEARAALIAASLVAAADNKDKDGAKRAAILRASVNFLDTSQVVMVIGALSNLAVAASSAAMDKNQSLDHFLLEMLSEAAAAGV